jgi:3-oxoacyl-(acyl-carrier-protein) synthase
VLTNSFGFGGANATLVMRRPVMPSTPPVPKDLPQAGRPAICITGWGAVSPAGWSAEALRQAVEAKTALPFATESRGEGAPERRFRKVPAMTGAPGWMKQPRLRRTTVAARYAVAAAVEALGADRLAAAQGGAFRVAVVFCTMNGCVQFSRRFFTEVLNDPKLASPILFPETVYNAPSSHLSALLNSREMNNTLVGDSAQFVRGMEMGAMWLEDGDADAVLVVAAEELDWLSDEALLVFDEDGIAAEGGAAVLMERAGSGSAPQVQLAGFTDVWTYGNSISRDEAARRVKAQLCGASPLQGNVLLCASSGMSPHADHAEQQAWADWKGPRASVRPALGEGLGVTSGWQVVHGCEAIASGSCSRALVSSVGLSQQVAGVVLKAG